VVRAILSPADARQMARALAYDLVRQAYRLEGAAPSEMEQP